jgi:hypothetical protein
MALFDLALDSAFATNKRIFFTYRDAGGRSNGNIVVARAVFHELPMGAAGWRFCRYTE